jgi:hypothetical protein
MDHEIVIRNAIIEQANIIARNETAAMFELVLGYGEGSTQATGKYPVTEEDLGRLLYICGVESWAELCGRPVRVRASRRSIMSVGHFIKDEWLAFDGQFVTRHD